ncbi:hypothetical protein DSBG_0217 [Desulfosporosinus sp. BG]|nr:hypothetical protein DSBG_0217 [Desulfosporosinus sp. BG]
MKTVVIEVLEVSECYNLERIIVKLFTGNSDEKCRKSADESNRSLVTGLISMLTTQEEV